MTGLVEGAVKPPTKWKRSRSVTDAERFADDHSARNEYCITRHPTPGKIGWHWTVLLSRQGRLITRSFSDLTYGGEELALDYARAYRDAVIRLIPPESRAQRRTKVRIHNRTGISGVARSSGKRGDFWIASYSTSPRNLAKRFSVRQYGEDRAKALAIAARREFMRLNNDSFLAIDEQALDVADAHFGDLLQPERSDRIKPLQILNAHSIDYRLHELDRWFDALRPCFVDVKIFPGKSLAQAALRATVSNGGLPNRLRKSGSRRITTRSLTQVLTVLWNFLRDTIVDMHDLRCGATFAVTYREVFFALDPAKGLFIRYRYDNADYDLRYVPPASLAGLLPDFQVPLPQRSVLPKTPDPVDQEPSVDSDGVVAERDSEEELYGLARLTPHDESPRWQLVLGRGGSAIRRRFTDGVYGDAAAALLMAQTYRDAATRLCPSHPVLRLQKRDAESERRVHMLNAWFDVLAPRFVNVYMFLEISRTKGRRLKVGTSGGDPPVKQAAWQTGLSQRSWQAALHLAWPKLQTMLTQIHGEECWNEFNTKYNTAFFATQEFERLEIRYRTTQTYGEELRHPPSELAQFLPGFTIPPLPPCEPHVRVSAATPISHEDAFNSQPR